MCSRFLDRFLLLEEIFHVLNVFSGFLKLLSYLILSQRALMIAKDVEVVAPSLSLRPIAFGIFFSSSLRSVLLSL